jgi:hypothetical protein
MATIFHSELAPYSLDSIVGLTAVVNARREQGRIDEVFRQEGLNVSPAGNLHPMFLRGLLTEAIRGRRQPDHAGRDISVPALLRAEDAFVAWRTQREYAMYPRVVGDGEQRFHRIMQSEYRDQLDQSWSLRELMLLRQFVLEAGTAGLDLDLLFEEKYGLTLHEFTSISFALYAQSSGAPGWSFRPDNFTTDAEVRIRPGAWPCYWAVCARDYEGLRSLASDPVRSVPGLEGYGLSPLDDHPLVIGSAGNVCVPFPRDVLDRPMRSLFFDTYFDLDDVQRGVYVHCWGRVFERYVAQCLRAVFRADTVLDAERFLSEPKDKVCDHVVLDGESPVLLEEKGVRFKLAAHVSRDPDLLRQEFVERGLVKGVQQLNRSAQRIFEGKTHLPAGTKSQGILLVGGIQSGFNSRYVRAVLENAHRERYGRPSEGLAGYRVLNDTDFETLIRRVRPQDLKLSQILKEVAADGERCTWDFANAIDSAPAEAHPLHAELDKALSEVAAPFGSG